jgi:hypothetical protein
MQKIVDRLPLNAEKKIGNCGKGAALSGLIRPIDNMELRVGTKV